MAETIGKDVQAKLDRLAHLEAKEQKAKDRTRKYGEYTRAYTTLMVLKAKQSGIKVTKAEVEEYLKKKKK